MKATAFPTHDNAIWRLCLVFGLLASFSKAQNGLIGSDCADDSICQTTCCVSSLCAESTECEAEPGTGGTVKAGEACTESSECISGCCSSGVCWNVEDCSLVGKTSDGNFCNDHYECESQCCLINECKLNYNCDPKPTCTAFSDCVTGCCQLGYCSSLDPYACVNLESGNCVSDNDCASSCCFLGVCIKSEMCSTSMTDPLQCWEDADCISGCCYFGECQENSAYCEKRNLLFDLCESSECTTDCCFAGICVIDNVCSWKLKGYIAAVLTLDGKNSGFEIGAAVILGVIVIICLLVVPMMLISKRLTKKKKQEVGIFKMKGIPDIAPGRDFDLPSRGMASSREAGGAGDNSNYQLATNSNLMGDGGASFRNQEGSALNGMQADEEDYPDGNGN